MQGYSLHLMQIMATALRRLQHDLLHFGAEIALEYLLPTFLKKELRVRREKFL